MLGGYRYVSLHRSPFFPFLNRYLADLTCALPVKAPKSSTGQRKLSPTSPQTSKLVHFAPCSSHLSLFLPHLTFRSQLTTAVVTYGDQNYPTIPANIDGSNVQEFCATDDNVCQPALKASLTSMGGISAGHFAYLSNGDLQQAADWIKTKLLS